jgi:hypothetical protein
VWCLLLAGALLIETAPGLASVRIRPAIQLVLLAVVAWCGVVALQYFPAGSFFPAGPGWNEAQAILGQHPLEPKPAAFAELPIAAIVPPLSLTLALLVGIVFGTDAKFTERIFAWVGWAGLVYAGYSVINALTDPTKLLWLNKVAYLDMLTGTFVNHNTAATYFGCIAIIWYVRFLREVRRRIDLTRWRDLEYLFNKFITFERYQLGYAAACFFLLATTFMTRSRGGSLLTLAALGLVSLLYFASELKDARRAVVGLFILAVAGTFVLDVAGGRLTNEIETRGVFDAGRADAWISSLNIIRDHPRLGTGLGTFANVFSAYRNPAGGIWGVMDRAHSTPVELLVEMGVPFGILIFALWAFMLAFLVRASLRASGNRIYVIAGSGIGILGTLHSLIDFSLQIPGFSLVCCSLVGAGVSAALLPTEQPLRAPGKSPAEPADQPFKLPTVAAMARPGVAWDKLSKPVVMANVQTAARDKPPEPATAAQDAAQDNPPERVIVAKAAGEAAEPVVVTKPKARARGKAKARPKGKKAKAGVQDAAQDKSPESEAGTQEAAEGNPSEPGTLAKAEAPGAPEDKV